MDRFYWTTMMIILILVLTAWRELNHRMDIEELRNELRETQREQMEGNKHLLELLKHADSRYEALVQMMTKEQIVRKKNDEETKLVIDGLLDIDDQQRRYITKLENDHSATVATQQAKIDHLEQEIRELKEDIRESKAEQREALGNMEEQVRRECQAEIAVLEKRVNDNHQIVNETLHGITELFIFEINQAREQSKNDTAALAKEIQQIKSQEHVIVQNEVIVQNGHQLQESTHHYRNWGAQYGAIIGERIGGYVQDAVTGLWSRAFSLLAKLK